MSLQNKRMGAMAKIQFTVKNFAIDSVEIILRANRIIRQYQDDNMLLTLRQLYYQMVARDWIPNTVNSYKRIGNIISDARDAGMIDWDAIEDRNRSAYLPTEWESPAEIVLAAARGFRINRWEGQGVLVEVMVEKDALSGILAPLCSQYHVRFSANKGYSSSTMMFEAGQRFRAALQSDRDINEVHVLYCGDHDPSGIDMTRDVEERFMKYMNNGSGIDRDEVPLTVHRLALNWNQVQEWNPPPNPAKETDSRYAKYRNEFGDESWELDAVEPNTLRTLVEDEILNLIDTDQWNTVAASEKKMRDELETFATEYNNRGKKKSKRNAK